MSIALPSRDVTRTGCSREDIERAFDRIATSPRYAHHRRIPDRIRRSLEILGTTCGRDLTPLAVYFLYIGVVDDWFDRQPPRPGVALLDRWLDPQPVFAAAELTQPELLATEYLKAWIDEADFAFVREKLNDLFLAAVREHQAPNFADYLQARRQTGRLTAEIATRLIALQPSTVAQHIIPRIGAVGNLVDSFCDLSRDARAGLLRFRPSIGQRIRLFGCIVREGLPILLRHPRLAGLCIAALADNCRDVWLRPPGKMTVPVGEC